MKKIWTRPHWRFCDNGKKVLPIFEFGSLDSKSKVLTTTPFNLLNLRLVFCLTYGDKLSKFSRENKHRRNYIGVFVTRKKKVQLRFELRSLNAKSKVLTTAPKNLLYFLLVFSLNFLDKRSSIFSEKIWTRLHWRFCDNGKKVLPLFELGSLDSMSKMLTTTP